MTAIAATATTKSVTATSDPPGAVAAAPNLFVAALAAHDVVYNPDAPGLPLLVARPVSALLHLLREPTVIGGGAELSALGRRAGLAPEDAPGVLAFLRRFAFVGPAGAAPRPMEEPTPWQAPRTLSVWLHINNDCNLACSYCFVSRDRARMSRRTLADAARQMVHTAGLHGIRRLRVKFSGGEPSLARDSIVAFLDELERRAPASLEIRRVLLTNGTRLGPSLVDFLVERRFGVGISLGGVGETHDRARRTPSGAGTFRRIEAGVDRLLAAGLRPHIMSTLGWDSLEDLPALARWLVERELTSRFSFVRECPDDDFDRYNAAIGRAMAAAVRAAEEHPFGVEFLRRLSVDELSFRRPLDYQPCGISKSHVVLNEHGQSCACPMTLAEPLARADDDLLAPLRAGFARYAADEPDPECRACRWLSVCGTGCPVVNERRHGHPNARSPLCDAYRQIIPEWIQAYGRTLERSAPTPAAAA